MILKNAIIILQIHSEVTHDLACSSSLRENPFDEPGMIAEKRLENFSIPFSSVTMAIFFQPL